MTCSTARPAAHATGLPPNVVPCEPGPSSAAAGADADARADREARAEALRDA